MARARFGSHAERVFKTRWPEARPTRSQCVRFSFETESLRQAVEVAAELRRVNPTGVRVRPAQFAPMGALRWAILVTTPPLEASEIAALEEDMRRVGWRAPGLRFTGWLYPSASVERPRCR